MKKKGDFKKPSNVCEFKEWLNEKFRCNFDANYNFYYNTVVRKLQTDLEESEYWKKISSELHEINDRYYMNKKVHLLIPSQSPKILTKSLNSLVIKAFRKNVLNNDRFPEEPEDGWILPENWFETINDIVRTTITVKYLDGVQIIINELEKIAKQFNYRFNASFEAREEGYYAAHSGITFPFSVPDKNFQPTKKNIIFEIQVTTQIQEIIKTLLHKHYEENRKVLIPKDYKWQWDYKSPEFCSNYLGHIIHYVEGMIVEIRDREK